MPAILGHEGAGIVASVGEAVSGIRVGDHVVLSYAACHHCENCFKQPPFGLRRF
ncbi:benzyl alcohol dehydrogenase [Klebsiella pneumoniae ISC21]|nr:benzyl alcohol dehydrogenase [Klebsiella pneumoniae ISC21]